MSDNRQASFFFVALINSNYYTIISFWLSHFILSIIFLNIISTNFVAITCLFFVLDRNLFLQFGCIYFSGKIKSSYEYYWPSIYIVYYFLFQTSYLKQTLFYHCNHCRASRKWLWTIIVCSVCCINVLILLQSYIDLIDRFYFIIVFRK